MGNAVTPTSEAAGRDGALPPFSSQALTSGETTRHPETGSAKVRSNPFDKRTRFPRLTELLLGVVGDESRKAQADLEACMEARKSFKDDAREVGA